MLKGNMLIAHGGGPTPVINSSLLGAVREAKLHPEIETIYGARFGAEGILAGDLLDLGQVDRENLALLAKTPASALGSCRRKLTDADYPAVLECFKRFNIRYFFYNGGNDSMDTCNKISKYMKRVGYECRIMGVPKTIDNDLYGTDHCPGYGSAAKYIATSIMEVARDTVVYDTGVVTVIECMGRHAGWLTAAAALANIHVRSCDLIYLPERDFSMEQFIADVKRVYERNGNCIVAVSEGLHYADGTFVSEAKTSATDGFGHAQLGGLAVRLANAVKSELGVKTRGIELSLLQRCAAHCASGTDINEAFMAGKAAVEAMLKGETDKMVGFECERKDGAYSCRTKLFELSDVANYENKVPSGWINDEGNDVTEDFVRYALPLINGETPMVKKDGLPDFAALKRVLA